MQVSGICEYCGARLFFEHSDAGSRIKCQHCGEETVLNTAHGGKVDLARSAGGSFTQPSRRKRLWPILAVGFCAIVAGVFAMLKYSTAATIGLGLFVFVAVVGGFALYWLPTIVGWNKKNATGIFLLNLFLGWALIPWVIALVWACSGQREETGPSRPKFSR